MEDIRLPMERGNMHDITQEGDSSQVDSSMGESQLDSLSTQDQKAIYEREAQIILDYSSLDDDYKEVGFHLGVNFLSLDVE
jgi:structural maintenance of chromosome 1